ncbi:MAG: hypothetical protein ACI87Q_003099 [Pseudohongiellaceae bacterium]|jgi:hypothetical protein
MRPILLRQQQPRFEGDELILPPPLKTAKLRANKGHVC